MPSRAPKTAIVFAALLGTALSGHLQPARAQSTPSITTAPIPLKPNGLEANLAGTMATWKPQGLTVALMEQQLKITEIRAALPVDARATLNNTAFGITVKPDALPNWSLAYDGTVNGGLISARREWNLTPVFGPDTNLHEPKLQLEVDFAANFDASALENLRTAIPDTTVWLRFKTALGHSRPKLEDGPVNVVSGQMPAITTPVFTTGAWESADFMPK